MVLNSSSFCVLLLALLGMHSGVQAGMMDNMMAMLTGSEQEGTADMPHFASLLQKSINANDFGNHNKHAQAAWKAEANVFLSMLQSMGKQVPAEKATETRRLVKEIIDLLTVASGDLKNTAQTEVTAKEGEMTGFKDDVVEYNGFAIAAKTDADTKNGQLTSCYAELRGLQSTHDSACVTGGYSADPWSIPEPSACARMRTTQKYNFTVAKKGHMEVQLHRRAD